MAAKLADVAVLRNGGQFDTFTVTSATAMLVLRECLPALVSRPLVGEFDSEPGFGSLLDVIDGDSGD
jgi:hypothetical protein